MGVLARQAGPELAKADGVESSVAVAIASLGK